MDSKLKSVVKRMAVKDLSIHPYAQRQLVPSKLRRLIAELDLDAIGVIHAVQYTINGVSAVWVIDGQHRVHALMEHGFGDWVVEVKIHLDVKNDERACALFLKLNDRSPVSPFDKYENELRAGISDAVGVSEVLKANKLKAARTAADGKVAAVFALKAVFSWDDGKTLTEGLATIIEAWGDRAAALEGKVIEGICHVIYRYRGKLDSQAFARTLSKYRGGPGYLLGAARALMEHRKSSLSRCVANVALASYNTGRRSGKLDEI